IHVLRHASLRRGHRLCGGGLQPHPVRRRLRLLESRRRACSLDIGRRYGPFARKMTHTAPTTRLMLVTPPVADAEAMSFRLMQAFAGGDVAAVLLRLTDGDDRSKIERVKRIA